MSSRFNSSFVVLAFASLGAASTGCGGGGGDVDQGPRDLGSSDGGPSDQGSDGGVVTLLACERDDLVMTGFDLAARTVRLSNPTGVDITIGDEGVPYQFCQGPGLYGRVPAGVVPAGGSLTVTVPTNLTINPANGTLSLYSAATYTVRDAMIDFVCWGDGAGTPRIDVAQRVGSDGTVLWDSQGCVQLAGATAFYMRTGVAGTTAVHYRTDPTNFVCMVENPDAGVDGGTGDAAVDAGPMVFLECDRDHLIIESVDTMTEEITLYNPTASPITTTGDYQLCQGPGNYVAVPAGTYPAFGRVTFAAPSTISVGSNTALALYRSAAFGDRDAMVDYVCWGTGGTLPRLTEAQEVGADGTVLWDAGGCPAAGQNATIYRVPGTEGNTAADYTTTQPVPGLDCAP